MCFGMDCPYENHTTGECGWFGGFPYPSDASCTEDREPENEPVNLKEYYDNASDWDCDGMERTGILDLSDSEGFCE